MAHLPLTASPARPAKLPAVDAARFLLAARLVDSLIHEARNPLNALSINLGILNQKLKVDGGGEVPAAKEKNLKAMREQLVRVDEILRLFAEFIAPKSAPAVEIDLSETLRHAIEVAGHECRQYRVAMESNVEPNIRIRSHGTGHEFLVMSPLLRGIARAQGGGKVSISLRHEGDSVLFTITDTGTDTSEPYPESIPALELLALEFDGQFEVDGGELTVELPAR